MVYYNFRGSIFVEELVNKKWYLNWKVWFGILISLGALYWTFKDSNLREILNSIEKAKWLVILASFPFFIGGILLRTYRWSYLIKDDTSTLRQRYNAINIGFMVTSLLPLRLGELARMYVFAKSVKRSAVEILATIVVERFFDVLAILILFVSALPFVPIQAVKELGLADIPQWKIQVIAWSIVIIALAIFLIVSRFGRSLINIAVPKFGLENSKIVSLADSLFNGLEVLWVKRRILKVLFLSLLMWTVTTLTFYVALFAFPSGNTTLGALLGVEGTIFLQGVLCGFVALPSAPGFFGVWHAAAKTAFIPYAAADHSSILAFAVVIHLLNYFLTIILGLEALKNEGMNWGDIQTSDNENRECSK